MLPLTAHYSLLTTYILAHPPIEFELLESDVAESMALLEMEFPLSFFDIVIHLSYCLVQELDLCGPVTARWMYLVKRYMKTLKNYMRNMA